MGHGEDHDRRMCARTSGTFNRPPGQEFLPTFHPWRVDESLDAFSAPPECGTDPPHWAGYGGPGATPPAARSTIDGEEVGMKQPPAAARHRLRSFQMFARSIRTMNVGKNISLSADQPGECREAQGSAGRRRVPRKWDRDPWPIADNSSQPPLGGLSAGDRQAGGALDPRPFRRDPKAFFMDEPLGRRSCLDCFANAFVGGVAPPPSVSRSGRNEDGLVTMTHARGRCPDGGRQDRW